MPKKPIFAVPSDHIIRMKFHSEEKQNRNMENNT